MEKLVEIHNLIFIPKLDNYSKKKKKIKAPFEKERRRRNNQLFSKNQRVSVCGEIWIKLTQTHKTNIFF